MDDRTSTDLSRLLEAVSPSEADAAWATFVEKHTRLILHVARSLGGDHDAAMDRYTYVLERLEDDDYRRLREYAPDGRTRFTTWLVVVVRRLCLDHYRSRYGRPRGTGGEEARRTRRTLTDHLEGHVDIARLASSAPNPEHELLAWDMRSRLAGALADLPPRDRVLLALKFEDGRSARAIADIMAFPTPFHVYRRLNRLLAQLRDRLEATGVDKPGPVTPNATHGSPSVQ
jgi:RNA polymerase sigma factor (sigma-70 family)